MNTNILIFLFLLFFFYIFKNPSFSLAQECIQKPGDPPCPPRYEKNQQGNPNTINLKFQLKNTGLGIQAQDTSGEGIVQTIVINVIYLFFAIGGIGSVIYFVWGAVDWILSGGDKEKIGNARKKMTHALIGLTLLALSFVIINLVGEIIGFNPLCNLQIRGLGDNANRISN